MFIKILYLHLYHRVVWSSTDGVKCILLSRTVKSINQIFVTVIHANVFTGYLGVSGLPCEIQEILESPGITCSILVQRNTGNEFIHGWKFWDRYKFFFWNRTVWKTEMKKQYKSLVSSYNCLNNTQVNLAFMKRFMTALKAVLFIFRRGTTCLSTTYSTHTQTGHLVERRK